MTCKKPLIRVYNWNDHSETIKVFGTEKYEEYPENTAFRIKANGDKQKWPEHLKISKKSKSFVGFEKIPCGKCIGCRLDYSKQWATRCTLEAKDWKQNWFVTLTYNDENLPLKEAYFDKESGEILQPEKQNKGSLNPDHIVKFMKDLRRYWKYHFDHDGIRFYICGEYGGKTERPHYHAILFNLPIKPELLKPFFINKEHQQIYLCDTIEKIWGKGIISVGQVTWSSCAYVARYMTKKQKGPGSEKAYIEKNQIPEFARMSRMPGIGAAYFQKNKEKIYKNDEIILPSGLQKVKSVKPPKYYDRLYDLESPEAMAAIKEKRKEAAIESEKRKTKTTSNDLKKQLEIEEKNLMQKAKMLKRSLEI